MKKILPIILVITMLMPILFSCSTPDESSNDVNNAGTSTDAATEQPGDTTENATENIRISPELEERDFEAAKINFLVMSKDRVPTNYSVEIYAAEENGDVINDAVYVRNRFIEEKYNVEITETPSLNLPNDARKSIRADDGAYDVFMMSIVDINAFTQDGSLVNMWEIPNIDLDKPWWNQRVKEDMSVSGKLPFMTGDLNIMDNNATWVTLFNKKLFQDNGIEMPYKMVLDGEWTLDRLNEYIKFSADLNGDAQMDEFDRYGLVSEYFNTYALLVASGGRIVSLDQSGAPQLTINQPRVFDVLDKVLPIQWDSEQVIQTERYTSKYSNPWAEVNRVIFREGRGFCYITGILSATLLRDMTDDFGIIPLPKFDPAQENYFTTVHSNNASTISVPVSNKNLDRTGFILEALSAESMYTLTPAYYDVTLNLKVARDEESSKMLDIILSSVIFDIGSIYNIGGVVETIKNLTKSPGSEFASQYEKIEGRAKSELEKFVEGFSK